MGELMRRFQMIAAQPHKATANGGSILIAEPKIERLAVTFAPVQSGSGTPSPTNVRPISGWTDIAVQMVAGKNLFDNVFPNLDSTVRYRFIYVGDSVVTVSTTCGLNTNGYTVLYVLPGRKTSGADSAANGFSNKTTRTIMPIDGYITIGYRVGGANGPFPDQHTTQVEYGTTATTIEPYHAITPGISLGSTYYGGTVDLVSGKLSVTMQSVDMGTLNYTTPESGGVTAFRSSIGAKSVSDNYQHGLNSVYPFAGTHFINVMPDKAWMIDASGRVYVRDDSYNDAASFKTAVTGCQMVYELATPQTYQLTPQAINALRGMQTVSSSAGSVEITYWTH